MVFFREFPHSFGDALKICREILSANRELVRKNLVDTEAEQLVIGAHRAATGERISRASLFARLQDRFPDATAARLLVLAGRRAEGIPLQHVLGHQVFLDHEYEVDSSVLIPRPETEVLVREALSELGSAAQSPSLGFEIGLGSGVISIELLHAFPSLRMVATEISDDATAIAKRNASAILGSEGASRLETARPSSATQVLEPFQGRQADFIISNPPYLDARAPAEFDEEVLKYEPKSALFPETGDPIYVYRKIEMQGPELLKVGGKVFLEIAFERAEATLALFGEKWRARLVPDLTGRPRVLIAEKR